MSSISSSAVGITVFTVGIVLMIAIAGVVIGSLALNKANNATGVVGPPGPAGPTGPAGILTVYREQLSANSSAVSIPVAYNPSTSPSVIYSTVSSYAVPTSVSSAQVTVSGSLDLYYNLPTTGSPVEKILLTLSTAEDTTAGMSTQTVLHLNASGYGLQEFAFTISDVLLGIEGRVYLRASPYQTLSGIGQEIALIGLLAGTTWIVNPVQTPPQ